MTVRHLLPRQSLSSRLGLEVQIRGLTQTADTVPGTGFSIVVRRAVPGGPIIPDGHVVLVPLEADLGVVVLCDQLGEYVSSFHT